MGRKDSWVFSGKVSAFPPSGGLQHGASGRRVGHTLRGTAQRRADLFSEDGLGDTWRLLVLKRCPRACHLEPEVGCCYWVSALPNQLLNVLGVRAS